MTRLRLTLGFIFTLCVSFVFSQNYERYKKLKDISLPSKNLGYEKKVSILVPLEWQDNVDKSFPLVIIFDQQNKRSHNYIINTIDYLTANEQMPSSIIISVASEQNRRYNETQYKQSDKNGLALENEKFVFDELIPLAEKDFKASKFRLLIGHSRYGYFTTSIFCERTNDVNAVIAISPFFEQNNINLTNTYSLINPTSFKSKKYYRFAIGNDFPDDYIKMDSIIAASNINSHLDSKGYYYKKANHNATPGIFINTALYEVFAEWSALQQQYSFPEQKDINVKTHLDQLILQNYGVPINFSIDSLNGKGWSFYNEKDFEKAIAAWQILMTEYPNFSEGYLQIIKAQKQLKRDNKQAVFSFNRSLKESAFYTESQKIELEKELQELLNEK